MDYAISAEYQTYKAVIHSSVIDLASFIAFDITFDAAVISFLDRRMVNGCGFTMYNILVRDSPDSSQNYIVLLHKISCKW